MGCNFLSKFSLSAWRDIEDIFGDGSDYAFALQEMNLGGGVDRYGDYVDDDDDKMNRKKEVKLTDLYEPAEIARRLLTEEDEVIRMKDLPERFQVKKKRKRG